MKLSIAKSELQRGLARLQAIVEKRNTMPILANVLLSASKGSKPGSLEIAATDLEVGIRGTHVADVEHAGAVTASAKKLYEIIRELPEERVQLEASKDAYLGIRCARAEFQLAGTAAEEYPALFSVDPTHVAHVAGVVLSDMIERTLYAASSDETRYNLNGVHIEYLPESGKLRMVATDGHRLAYVDRALGADFEGLRQGVIIPRKGLTELKRLVDEEDADEVELGFEGNSCVARKGNVTLVMRLIEGEFPNYRQVIPRETGRILTLDTALLSQSLRRVVLLSAERSRAVKFEFGPGTLRLSSSNPDLGEAHEEVDVDFEGEPVVVAFNARYLIDALAVTRAKEVRLMLLDSLSPAQLVPTDDADALAVVMPMRL